MLKINVLILAAVPCLFPASLVPQDRPTSRAITFKESESDKHLLGNWPDIRLSPIETGSYRPFQGLRFTVTVSANGEVIGVALETPEEPQPAGTSEGERVIRALHFKPFTHWGRPIVAQFPLYLPVFPAEKIPAAHVPFPDVNDRSSLVMTLERTTCYGTCPWYSVEVFGDGRVEYEGHCFVAERGTRSSVISADAVNRLLGAFRNADFFSLKSAYSSLATDLPTFTVSIAFDKFNRTVVDYNGREVGMPDAVVGIENAIDRETNSAQWTNRNGHWKPRRDDGCN